MTSERLLQLEAEIAQLRAESEERLQNCAALVAENERLRAAPATAPEQMPLERDCICHQYLHLDAYSGGAAPEGLHGALWVVVEGVRKKYVLADQSSEPKDMPALATTPKQPRPFVPWSKEAEMLESWAAQPATAPEKTVKEIMEFVRHYAANTFSSATLEDKIRRSLTAPATAPEHLKARPDFIAGYNEDMADAKRMQMAAALEYQRQLVNVQVRSARTTCAACGWESSFEPPIHYETCPSCGGTP
jgi:hypothetical protein